MTDKLREEILEEFSYDGGKGEDLMYAADLPEIIAKVREHDAMQTLNATGYTKHIQAKTIERVLANVEEKCGVLDFSFGDYYRKFDVLKAIKGVGDE